MFEKEIRKVKNRTSYTIGLGKNDGEVHEGKCYILYPEELDELKKSSTEIQKLEDEIKSLKTQLKQSSDDYQTQQKKINELEESNSLKDAKINQLQHEKDVLNEEKNQLNTTITTMKIQHDENLDELDEKYENIIAKYNDSVDMIHSLISTTTIIKGDIENMPFQKRAYKFKKNVNSVFEEKNMTRLIEQHLINEESQLPQKSTKKE